MFGIVLYMLKNVVYFMDYKIITEGPDSAQKSFLVKNKDEEINQSLLPGSYKKRILTLNRQ